MILKTNNKCEDFYKYMGKFFGSRVVERQTNDRIYDDNNKDWYIYVEEDRVVAFISISNNIIKNIYTLKEEYLEELLNQIKKENKISASIVTNAYSKIYIKCGFEIDEKHSYKNFVTIIDKSSELVTI